MSTLKLSQIIKDRTENLTTISLKRNLKDDAPLQVRCRQLRNEEYMRNRFGDFGGLQIWADPDAAQAKLAKPTEKMSPSEIMDYYNWMCAITACAVVEINDTDDEENIIWRKVEWHSDKDAEPEYHDAPYLMAVLSPAHIAFDDNLERVVGWAVKDLNEGPGSQPATFQQERHDHMRVDGPDLRDAAARVSSVGAGHAGE